MLTKSWAIRLSLMIRMGFVKRKGSTAVKVPVAQFENNREQYLTDIRAAVLMNDISSSLVINCDQRAIHLVPVSSWTMSREGEKSIPIASLDDKREITVVLAATLTGEYTYLLKFSTRVKRKCVIQQLTFHLSGMCGTQRITGLMRLQ